MSERDGHSGAMSADSPDARILALLDGELDATEMEAFEAELAQSPELAADALAYRGIADTLLNIGDDFKMRTPKVNVHGDVVAKLRQDNVVPFLVSGELECKIEEELEFIGAAYSAQAPTIDIKTAVLEKIRAQANDSTQAPKDNIVPLRARPPIQKSVEAKSNRRPVLYAVLAVAASLLLSLSLYNEGMLGGAPGDSLDGNPDTLVIGHKDFPPADTERESVDKRNSRLASSKIMAVPRPVLANIVEASDDSGNSTSNQGIYGTISMDTVLENKRNANMDSKEGINALAQLKTWSSLTPEQARRLLEEGGLSADAILGVAQFLPPEEAAALLEAQVQTNPENPYLHYSLAAIYAGMGQGADTQTHLAALERQDPGNAMNPFLEAGLARQQGDDSMAMALLLESAQSDSANTYSLEAANYRAEALTAQGFDPGVANYLAALSAGTNEYNQILSMTNDFVQYGQEFEDAQDYDAALSIYESLNQFGNNVSQNADFANEQLAGLDTQNAALTAIQGVVNILQDPVSSQVLESGLEVFNQGLQGMGTFFTGFNTLMNNAAAEDVTNYVNSIMEMGDIAFMGQQNEGL